jgi:hypothetical protein
VVRKEDHYLLVMVNRAASSSKIRSLIGEDRGPNRFAKLILIGGAGFVICAVLFMAYMWLKYREGF